MGWQPIPRGVARPNPPGSLFARPVVRRFALAALAFLVTDLLVGLAVFSVAVLAIFTAFAVGWITLVTEYAANSRSFGSLEQLRSAQALLLVAPSLAALVVFLSVRALRIPRWIWGLGRASTPPVLSAPLARSVVPPPPRLPKMNEAALWAERGHPANGDYHFVSLLLRQSK